MDESVNPINYKRIRIVEEVPGVPETQRWFICGGKFEYPYPCFSSCGSAEGYLKQMSITDYTVEYFEP